MIKIENKDFRNWYQKHRNAYAIAAVYGLTLITDQVWGHQDGWANLKIYVPDLHVVAFDSDAICYLVNRLISLKFLFWH